MRRRQTILMVGSGDIALRVARLLKSNYRMLGTARRPERHVALHAAGITPLSADLDRRHALRRLAGMSQVVLHLAPPQEQGDTDTRTRHLLAALSAGTRPAHLVYISTSGVYGDCGGAHVTEARPLHPATARARRRADAERRIRIWAARNGVRASILRVPGIYAADRLPLERLRAGTPAILPGEDSHTNHIHADDLARVVVAALRRGRANRIYHASDDSDLKMGDYFDAVADAYGLPHPPRLLRAQVQAAVSPALWSFMNESRRLDNTRMKRELKVRLRYPTVMDGLRAAVPPAQE
ncbi:MAG TPA: NAD-dependent epimerase/dehydratase family protein [Gallionellaceae bacterium]|nr:NAD-dependent epimerase/dehydratase family protein [Gallionellaceae bacterium]